MFGRPAAFAGRRAFACIVDDALAVKLPADVARRELKQGGRQVKGWIHYRPRTSNDMRRLASVLEVAARHAAQQLTQE